MTNEIEQRHKDLQPQPRNEERENLFVPLTSQENEETIKTMMELSIEMNEKDYYVRLKKAINLIGNFARKNVERTREGADIMKAVRFLQEHNLVEGLTESEELVAEEGDTITCSDCGKVDCMCYEDKIEHDHLSS